MSSPDCLTVEVPAWAYEQLQNCGTVAEAGCVCLKDGLASVYFVIDDGAFQDAIPQKAAACLKMGPESWFLYVRAGVPQAYHERILATEYALTASEEPYKPDALVQRLKVEASSFPQPRVKKGAKSSNPLVDFVNFRISQLSARDAFFAKNDGEFAKLACEQAKAGIAYLRTLLATQTSRAHATV